MDHVYAEKDYCLTFLHSSNDGIFPKPLGCSVYKQAKTGFMMTTDEPMKMISLCSK